MKKALLVIARTGFQDHELDGTREGLLDAGFEIVIASTEAGECSGKFGAKEQATIGLEDIDISIFDRIAFIGGPGALALADFSAALALARSVSASGKPLGAICIAPIILAKAGVLQGKKATVWDRSGEQAAILRANGAVYTGEAVTVDGMIVTANGPDAADAFGVAFATL